MLTTNLLPLSYRKTVLRAKAVRVAALSMTAIICLGIINAVFIMPSYLPLYFEKKELIHNLEIEKEVQNRLEITSGVSELKLFSNTLSQIRDELSRSRRAADLVGNLISPDIEGVKIESIRVDETGSVGLNGTAKTRKNLLNFETQLKSSSHFETISSPLSNIIRESNIRFTIEGTLKEPYRFNSKK